ncbi:MAG: FAD-dependent oxidoreductase [Acidobacteriota bacterium]|nr:FAD-dependent oxidoreductase [Blastocatellia bacterium]MDW8411153.1 FAD-dependent oxidoreductase [Acidobacteriota bacterium]
MFQKIVIIGGLAGGLTAASWARRTSAEVSITVVERGLEVAYSECGLPYVLSGEIGSFEQLVRYTPQEFAARYNVELLTGHIAEAIDPRQGCVEVRSASGGSRVRLYYDQLIVATGASPAMPAVAGLNLAGVFALRHLPEARTIDFYLRNNRLRSAVVVGAGWLGLEMAEVLVARGLRVTIVERTSRLAGFSGEICSAILEELTAQGVRVCFESELLGIDGIAGTVSRVSTRSGEYDADIVFLATGVRPAVELARGAGLRLGAGGAIAVNERQMTSYPDIYAAGDCSEVYHIVLNRPVYLPLGTTANKQGRVAGINAAGGRAQFRGVVGTSALKVFSLEAATTGLSLEEALQAGYRASRIVKRSISRAGYYPGAERLIVEIVYDEATGRLLGCRMCGREAVAKRIDVAAAALYAKMRVDDLLQLDLSYAPPLAPVWEALLIAARSCH